jgi:uncharacterized protein YecT (DUF1311 family)
VKYFVLLLLFFVPTLATARCRAAVSTKGMQDCMDTEWKKSDAELNRVYQESMKKLNSTQSKPSYSRKRNAPGSAIATPSAKPTAKCSQMTPPLAKPSLSAASP